MKTFVEPNNLGDLLKYEADKNYCREVVTVAQGQNLKLGTILGMVEADDQVKAVSLDNEATDGTYTAIGVLLEDVDATSEAKKSFMVARRCHSFICMYDISSGSNNNSKKENHKRPRS